MQINVTTRHGHLNDATQERLTSKAEKLVRIFERLTSIEVIVDLKDSSKPRVDLKVSAEHKHDFIAHDQAENLLTAVESAVHKMEQQLRRYKEKVQTRGRDPNAKRQESITEGSEATGDIVDE
ncbi:MAG: ribosome-associated translation inhibitor RaiA [Planctomycetota bacterium]